MSEPLDPSLQGLTDCGCDAGIESLAPSAIDNPDGQNEIAYRIRTHGAAKSAMLAGLSSADRPALHALGTRRDDDLSIALIDAWACVTDVLTFYQERLANESYLRTATERRSILELAQAIGYQLDPGVAATTALAFTLEASAVNATVPSGTKVQSIPGQNEDPQTFETVEEIPGRPEWNRILPETEQRWLPRNGDRVGWLQGIATNLRVGNAVLFLWYDENHYASHWLWDVQTLLTVEPDFPKQRTKITWKNAIAYKEGGAVWPANQRALIMAALRQVDPRVYALRAKGAIFGHNAANWRSLSETSKADYLGHPGPLEPWEKREWPGFQIYANAASPSDQPNRELSVPPTPQDIADAATSSASKTARAAQAEVPQAAVSFAGAGVSLLQAGAKKAKEDMDDAYGPAAHLLQNVLQGLLDVLGKFGLDTSNITGIGNVSAPISVSFDWLSFLTSLADPTSRSSPLGWSNPDLGPLTTAINSAFNQLKNVVFALPNAAAITQEVQSIADALTKLVANNPGFLPFNALKDAAAILSGNDPADAAIKGKVESSVENIIEATVAAGITRAVSDAMGKILKVALQPPDFLPAPTPDSVAHVARITVKVAKYSAVLASIPSFGVALGQNLLQQAGNRFVSTVDPYSTYHYVESGLNGSLLPLISSRLGNSPLAGEFTNLDDDDRTALIIVLCTVGFGAAATGAAADIGALLIAGGAALGAAVVASGVLTFVTLGAAAPISAALLLLAPGALAGLVAVGVGATMIMGVGTALGAVGLTISLGPLLLRGAKRSERAVIQAVATALLPKRVPLPARRINPRDYAAIDLDATYPQAVTGSWLVLSHPSDKAVFRIEDTSEVARAEFQLSNRVTRAHLAGDGLAGPFRLTAGIIDQLAEQQAPSKAIAALRALGSVTAGSASAFLAQIFTASLPGASALEIAAMLKPHLRDLLLLANTNPFADDVRNVTVLLQSEALITGAAPLGGTIAGEQIFLASPTPDLPVGRLLIVTGQVALSDPPQQRAELVKLEKMTTRGGRVQLQLASPGLRYAYLPSTVAIYANVSSATHGETTNELLGSGDATQPFQRFVLKQVPITYTRGGGLNPTDSSLSVWVDDVLWHEVSSFYGQPANARVFVTRRADDGVTTVIFGDGVNGSRLPTGQNNVRARYRKGTGLAGMVRAGQLRTLLSRPLGLQDVVNPLAANGADDPETLAEARQNAPLTVRTLGRVVSLQDYEDFARAYPGVTKALATWTWNGRVRAVMLTLAIAQPADATPGASDDVINGLLSSLKKISDPYIGVTAVDYRPAAFRMSGKVRVQSDYDPAKVLEAAKTRLRDAFGFTAREFGQPVFLSEVVATVQTTEGVESFDLDSLQRTDRTEPLDPANRLLADLPVGGVDAGVPAAELLLLDETSLAQLVVVS